MRLKRSRVEIEEQLIELINDGHRLLRDITEDYKQKAASGQFVADQQLPGYRRLTNEWAGRVVSALDDAFPTDLERNLFTVAKSYLAVSYPGVDDDVGHLTKAVVPDHLERLHRILAENLPRYTDLPIQDRLFVEDIDSFRKVRDINPAQVASYLTNGRLEMAEDDVQLALEAILNVAFHRKDWGGEGNDLYTANVIINGSRTATGFLLKGSGLKTRELQLSGCGKNGDQIVRLFETPARLFVIQYIGPVADMVVKDALGKVAEKRGRGEDVRLLIMDGQDTARLLLAYGKLSAALKVKKS